VVRAAQRVKDAEERLQRAREALYAEIHKAQDAGVSISAMARALGVTRQAVQRLARRP